MNNEMILGRTLEAWIERYPLLLNLRRYEPLLWMNPEYAAVEKILPELALNKGDMEEAEMRWRRFASLIQKLFPETQDAGGIIESPLKEISGMKDRLKEKHGVELPGKLLMKCDHQLPVAGSIKARGGIYEVLKYAEGLAIKAGLMTSQDDYSIMTTEPFRNLFQQYSISVGSTGNLGLSIGMISAAIGFRVTVHMSADAKEWKKKLLREKGVIVIEYASDYSKAVEEGRRQSELDPNSYFIDDEKSKELFLGYSVAAYRLKEQLHQQDIVVDEQHPLIVYLPCGVGGAPGGITFGLKLVFGDHVHCFFAEPTHSPCMLMGLMTGERERIRVQDFGIDNITEADGLAVGSPSGLVAETVGRWIEGVFTVEDDSLYPMVAMLKDTEDMKIEPSAAAGLLGLLRLRENQRGSALLQSPNATHIIWTTGGLFVPQDLMEAFYRKGKSQL